MRGSTESRSFRAIYLIILLIVTCALCPSLAAQDAAGGWQRGDPHKMHWPQPADLSAAGVGVSLSEAILADDFRCSASGPVRNIHLWASCGDDNVPAQGANDLTVELSIYADISADGATWGRPGELLWTETFPAGQYTARQVHSGPSNWYEPVPGELSGDGHRQTYQYSFCVAEPFVQQEGTVYWLGVSIAARVGNSFGWKSTGPQWRWNSEAAYLPGNAADWLPLSLQQAGEVLDLAFVITSGDDDVAERDLGDAPDSSNSFADMNVPASSGVTGRFPTVYEAGSPPYGPMHLMPRDAFFLGRWTSLENEADLGPDEDSINNLRPPAGQADSDGGDDGLQFPVTMPSCQLATLDYAITRASDLADRIYVNVWCDWNRDGDWNDTVACPDGAKVPEWAVQNDEILLPEIGMFIVTTPEFLCWHPDTPGAIEPLWVRITTSEIPWAGDPAVGGSGPEGGYAYGETEDYYLLPQTEPGKAAYDWADAPDSVETPGYPTLDIHDGAWHIIGGPWLGGADDRPDGENDGQPQSRALGDDGDGGSDENGVDVPPLIRGEWASVTLEVGGGGGVVQGWIDFDGDGVWQDHEAVCDGFLPAGVHSLSFAVPQDAMLGRTFSRWRISSSGGLDPFGPALDGEVEDHEAWICPVPSRTKWRQWPDMTPAGVDLRPGSTGAAPRMLADDFLCVSRDLLTSIRLWGSWKNDERGQFRRIAVSIYANDPAGPAGADKSNPVAQPGPEVLWDKVFSARDCTETLYHTSQVAGQWWWDPGSGDLVEAGQSDLWQIDLPVDPNEAFLQTGSPEAPQTYWLAVAIETAEGQFGWRTRHSIEPAAHGAVRDVGENYYRSWQELRYPQSHPAYELATNAVDAAFCLTFTPEPLDVPTVRPASVTQCPAVETQCPATATQCPTVATECPATETQCPAVATSCPAVATECPNGPTYCPPFTTQCPVTQTVCPVSLTTCPTTETKCPATTTQCPTFTTMCPPATTQCPANATQCPTVQTQCPVTSTQCPSVLTQCPAVETRCPATETQCPPMTTLCPAVATACPAQATACPIDCTETSGLSVSGATLASYGQPCPVVEGDCGSVAQYLSLASVR